jgi:surface polysaccharide O-acyltransferase-like enzyme
LPVVPAKTEEVGTMETLHEVLTWILEIAGAVVILVGAYFWLKAAAKGQSTARSFMALVFTFIFFLVVILRTDIDEGTIRWLSVVYGGMMAFYIIARMIEHREEIKAGKD